MRNRQGDRQELQELADHGADLSETAHMVHILHFNDEKEARAAAHELFRAGFRHIEVHAEPPHSIIERFLGPRHFSCIAENEAVPSEAAVFATTDWMNDLARRHHGDYDGWQVRTHH